MPVYQDGLRGSGGIATIEVMTDRISRRRLVLSALAASRLAAASAKGAAFHSDWQRFPDPSTELPVYRLTDPDWSSTLPAHYNRAISRNSAWMVFCCDRQGSPQAFRMDLKTGETRQLTEAGGLDGASLTLTADNRTLCYFAGRTLYATTLATLRERPLYEVPEGWERTPGMSIEPDGTDALFIERRGEQWRLRAAPLVRAAARTIVEAPFAISDPVARPLRAQILYRQGNAWTTYSPSDANANGLWLVNSDGQQNRRLKLADGNLGPANWAPDGKTVLYLNLPADTRQLNAIREYTPDANTDALVVKTSQFIHFGFNRNTSVFVGASRNQASPNVLLQLRITGSELVLCEHKASRPETVAPMFSPDAQRIYFQSDRTGKPALYCMHLERLVEKIEAEGG
ncbi:MAG: oligogalacturonate lyase family protein [Bryobacteraceae bacterium]